MTGIVRSGRRGVAVLTLLLLVGAAVAGIVAAAPVSVAVDAPETAEPGDEVRVTYEISNEGDEATSALGLNVTALPADATVEAIETDDGSTAENRNAVFWVDPVEPGATVSVTFVLSFDENASPGERLVEAEVASSDDSAFASTTITVEEATETERDADSGGNDDTDGDDGSDATDEGSTDADEGSTDADEGSTDADETIDETSESDAGDTSAGLPLEFVAGGAVAFVLVALALRLR